MKYIQSTLFVLCILSNGILFAQGTSGLIAHWDMNGGTTDVSGHGHTGHPVNVTPATGINGTPNTAYSFSGTNSYISAANATDMNLTKYSICATLQLKGYYSGTCQGNWIFGRGDFSTGHTGDYGIGFSDNAYNSCSALDTTLETINGGAGSNTGSASTPWAYTPHLTSFAWHRAVLVYDSTQWKVYLDHSLIYTMGSSAVSIGTCTDSFSIGQNLYSVSGAYPFNFKGLIDDIMVYNRPLTDSEAVHYGDTCGHIVAQPAPVSQHIGGNAVFTVNTAMGAATYQWQKNAGSGFVNLTNTAPYSGVTTNTLTITGVNPALHATHYRCVLSNTWVCTDTTTSAILNITNLSVNNFVSSDQVTIFPNPASDKVSIQMPVSVGASQIQVINETGQVVLTDSFIGATHSINVSKLSPGLYILKIKGEDFSVYKQLLKN